MSDQNWGQREQELIDIFDKCNLISLSEKEIIYHLETLSKILVSGDGPRSRNQIRSSTLRNLLLIKVVERLNKQNTKLTFFVIALAIIATISSIMQIILDLF
ncbi:hypothetical protein H8E88_30605 [candidate division KSB1 bacterium]|nr:hypothetical protein [candidate division KSB1 bacterium]MBL7093138.1 hypothetical protein [candidate division KSB1 bacterium]